MTLCAANIKAFWEAGEYERILPLLPENAYPLRAKVLFWIAMRSKQPKQIEELIYLWPTVLKHLNLSFEELQSFLKLFFTQNPQFLKLLHLAHEGRGAVDLARAGFFDSAFAWLIQNKTSSQEVYFLAGLARIGQRDKKAARYLSQSGAFLKTHPEAQKELIELLQKPMIPELVPIVASLAKELKNKTFSEKAAMYLAQAARELAWNKEFNGVLIQNYLGQAKLLWPQLPGLAEFQEEVSKTLALFELDKALKLAKFSKAADIAMSFEGPELKQCFFQFSENMFMNSKKYIPPAATRTYAQRLLPHVMRLDKNHPFTKTLKNELGLCS